MNKKKQNHVDPRNIEIELRLTMLLMIALWSSIIITHIHLLLNYTCWSILSLIFPPPYYPCSSQQIEVQVKNVGKIGVSTICSICKPIIEPTTIDNRK